MEDAAGPPRPVHDRSLDNDADYATAPFRAALDALLATARRRACAVMCAEAVWWRCHRRIIADHVLARGVPVIHLLGPSQQQPATLTPFAVVGGDAVVTYPAPGEPSGSGRRAPPGRARTAGVTPRR